MKKIVISDVSLKESAKNQALNLNFKEKLEIAKRLCELGVDVIEISASKQEADKVLIKTISAFAKGATISLAIDKEEDLALSSCVDCAKKSRLSINVPVSAVLMEYFSAKRPKAVLEYVKDITAKAKEKNPVVEVNLLDATRADYVFLTQAINFAIESGATIITLSDIAGAFLPKEFGEFLNKLYLDVPQLKSVAVGVAVCDDFNMAIPTIFESLEQGVSEIKCSVLNGLGFANFEKTVKALEFLGSKKGYTNSINKTALTKIIGRIESEISKSGSYATARQSAEDNKEIDVNISEEQLKKYVSELGFDLTEEDFKKVWTEYNRLAERKNITLRDLEEIVSNYALQVPEVFVLDRFSVNSSNVMQATASVVVIKEGKEISGLSYGNGAVDACFRAIENIAGEHFELEDFEIGAVTEGREALGKAIIKLRVEDKVYSGRGLSTDVIGASIRAYIDAINKIAYERGNK